MIRFLALGDSYTIGESVAEDQRWPSQLTELLARKGYQLTAPLIIAATGWRTDQLREAIISAKLSRDFDLVSLLIGVNNLYQGKSITAYEEEFAGLLDLAIGHAENDESKVIVLSIPDYGYTPFGKEKQTGISKSTDLFNAVNKKISLIRNVRYIDITDISRNGLKDPRLVASDGLHPSGMMYRLWVDRVMKEIGLAD